MGTVLTASNGLNHFVNLVPRPPHFYPALNQWSDSQFLPHTTKHNQPARFKPTFVAPEESSRNRGNLRNRVVRPSKSQKGSLRANQGESLTQNKPTNTEEHLEKGEKL